MNHGFVKVASAIPGVHVADCRFNTEQIIKLIIGAEEENVEILCFPELSVTAYTCQDLFESTMLIDEVQSSIITLLEATRKLNVIAIVGLPMKVGTSLMNCAAVIQRGKLLGIVPKTYLPNYKEFYERRWFASARDMKPRTIKICGQTVPLNPNLLFETQSCTFGIEICEDLWAPIPQSSYLALAGAEIIFNLSADDEGIGKNEYVKNLVRNQSARTLSGYVFSSCGFGESTQDLVFAGNAFICENNRLLAESERFSLNEQLVCSEIDVELLRHERRVNTTFGTCAATKADSDDFVTIPTVSVERDGELSLTRKIDAHPFIPTGKDLDDRCNEIVNIQVEGLAKRIAHIHAKSVVVGISGGLDSTLALLVSVQAFDKLGLSRKGITGITMPGFGTSDRTHTNATDLMNELGITIREIKIGDACLQHFADIGHNADNHDITYENSQARERTQVLMDVANQVNGIVVGTGDLSELALGWATYNGDHMSMYGVNCSIPKTLIRHLIVWIANHTDSETERQTLMSIVDTPISPELIPTNANGEIYQKTEDTVGPYELHDFFLYYTLRYGFRPSKIYFLAKNAFQRGECALYDDETIKKWLKTFFHRFFTQQFKRSCLPDGPKVGSCSLSPRGDWRMPSDADETLWKDECESL